MYRQKNYDLFFENHPQPMWVYEAAGFRFLAVNKAAVRLYGYSREEFLTMTGRDIRQPEETARFEAYCAQLSIETKDAAFEDAGLWRHRKKGGASLIAQLAWSRVDWDDRPALLVCVRDLTAEVAAAEALRLERDRAKMNLDIAPVMYLMVDTQCKVQIVNRKGCEVLGYAEDELLGKDWIDTCLPPEIRAELRQVFDGAMRGERELPAYYENKILLKNGEHRIIAWHNTAMRDNAGRITATISAGQDLTEHWRAEEKLLESEIRFRQLAENIQEVFWLVDPAKHAVIYASPSYEQIWGRPLSALYAQRDVFSDAIHPDDRQRVIDALPLQIEGKFDIEYRIRRPDGSIRWIRDRAFPVRDLEGKIYRLAGLAQNITTLKETTAQLHDWKNRYEAAIHASHQMLYDWESATHKTIYGGCFEEVLGYTPDELAGGLGRWRERIHPEDLAAFDANMDRARQAKQHFSIEYRLRRKNGTYATCSDRGHFLLNAEGAVTHLVGFVEDIGARKQLERVAMQTEKLSALGLIVAGVAHEINNPLAIILGFSQTVLQRLQSEDVLFKPLQSIEREAERCRNLVRNLLLFSRERQPGTSDEGPVSVVEGALSLIEPQANIRHVTLKRDFAPNLPNVSMDRNQIQQVLINLCSNAIDAMPAGGTTTVALRRDDAGVLISISDTGTGIPADIQGRIFEPFFTTKEPGKGTGLGLSLAYEIIKKHQSTLEFQTEVDRGTTFRFHLPAVPALVSETERLAKRL